MFALLSLVLAVALLVSVRSLRKAQAHTCLAPIPAAPKLPQAQRVGRNPFEQSPEEHDRIMADIKRRQEAREAEVRAFEDAQELGFPW